MVGLERFGNEDGIAEEYGIENNHTKASNTNLKESTKSVSWYITAFESLLDAKEQAEADLICNDKGKGDTRNKSILARCNEKMKYEAMLKTEMLHGKGRCTLEVWRCFSGVLEGVVKHVEKLGDLSGWVNWLILII